MSVKTLSWEHVGPAREESIPVPPLAWRVAEYAFRYDPHRKRVVYATSPQPHQFGHAWAWDVGGYRDLFTTARYDIIRQETEGMFQVVLAEVMR